MCFRGLLEGYWKNGIFLTLQKYQRLCPSPSLCKKERGPWKKGAVYSGKDFLGTCPNSGPVFKVFEVDGAEHEPEFKG